MTEQPRSDDGADRKHLRSSPVVYSIDDGEQPSEAIVRSVASYTATPILDLEPLYDVIDPDHVDGVFEQLDETSPTELSFEFNGCGVTVRTGEVRVRPAEGDSERRR